ncbi:MAG: hypothetical protein J7L42_03655 [Elusimicrobia bacterium]|nr:hypothetical protein [Elusimicrobiota bacterium]
MKFRELVDNLRILNTILSEIYFKIYRSLEENKLQDFWYNLCEQKQKLAGEMLYLESLKKFDEETIDVDRDVINSVLLKIKKNFDEIPEKLTIEDALKITFNVESSIINALLFTILEKAQESIPESIDHIINIFLPSHIMQVMDTIIENSKDPHLVEKARLNKMTWSYKSGRKI